MRNYRVGKVQNRLMGFPSNVYHESVNFNSNNQNENVLWFKKYKGFGSFGAYFLPSSNHASLHAFAHKLYLYSQPAGSQISCLVIVKMICSFQ